MTAKQDRQGARTFNDYERRYDFETRFADIMGVATDARLAAEQAKQSVDGLTQEQIFNILTDNGKEQGIYRQDGLVYINASYIKSGKISADYIDVASIKVDAAQINSGTIDSARIPNLSAGKITSGTLDASKVSVTNLNANNITSGTLSADRIDGSKLNIKEGASIAGWSVGASSLTAGTFGTSGFIGLYTSYPTSANYRLVIGSKFKVNKEGEITATGGSIGGWTISGSNLSGTSGAHGTVTISPTGVNGQYQDASGTVHTNTISWYRILSAAMAWNG